MPGTRDTNTETRRSQGREELAGPGFDHHPHHTLPAARQLFRTLEAEIPCLWAWSSPCRLFPLVLVQVGGGEVWGLTTGANALFCFTAETMLAGEKEKMPEELLQLEGRLVDEAMVGLDGTTENDNEKGELHPEMRGLV